MEDAVRTEQGGAGADPAEQVAAEAFIAKWQGVAASELSTSQSFLIDLCALLGVDAPRSPRLVIGRSGKQSSVAKPIVSSGFHV